MSRSVVVALVADCGSGYSRVVRVLRGARPEQSDLGQSGGTGDADHEHEHVYEIEKPTGSAPALAKLLGVGGKGGEEVLELVARFADAAPDAAVIIGATAGVRAALAAGDVAPAAVEDFRASARARFPANLAFAGVLSAQEEALAECTAALHAVAALGGLPGGCAVAGVASGGGMSGQLALVGGGGGGGGAVAAGQGQTPAVYSYRNLVLAPGSLCVRARAGGVAAHELFAALPEYRAAVRASMGGMPSGLSGCFVAIEWFGHFIATDSAEAAGHEPGKRVLSLGYEVVLERDAIIAAASSLLEELRLGSGCSPTDESAMVSRPRRSGAWCARTCMCARARARVLSWLAAQGSVCHGNV